MITAEAEAESAVPKVPEAGAVRGDPELKEPTWPWVSPGPEQERERGGRYRFGSAGFMPSHAPCSVERCPDPGAGAAHPPVAG